MTFEPRSATVVEGSYAWAQYTPHASLAPWVSSYWTLRTNGPHIVRTLPDACIDVIITFLGDGPRAFIAGAQSEARTWRSRDAVDLLGARLLPGAGRLLGISLESLEEGWTPLESALPRTMVSRLLRDVTRNADLPKRTAVLDAFFSERLLNRALDPQLTIALRVAFACGGDISVAQLARSSGVHARTLARMFDRNVGLPPKRFLRIVRLQTALRALPAGTSLARVAADMGYFDQAHFIREVRSLLDATPTEVKRISREMR